MHCKPCKKPVKRQKRVEIRSPVGCHVYKFELFLRAQSTHAKVQQITAIQNAGMTILQLWDLTNQKAGTNFH